MSRMSLRGKWQESEDGSADPSSFSLTMTTSSTAGSSKSGQARKELVMRHLSRAFSYLFIALCLGTTHRALAATNTVTTTADTGAGSLRQTVASATAGDTINFTVTGTITLTSGEIALDKGLTLSGPGADVLAVSGNNASRIFKPGR